MFSKKALFVITFFLIFIFTIYAYAQVSHPASEITPGTFGGTATDAFIFPGNVGIGGISPSGKLTLISPESTNVNDFYTALTKSGINIVSSYTTNAETPGIFWSTSNNNPTKPKAGINIQETGIGTFMFFHVSDNYATGITRTPIIIKPSGDVDINGNLRAYGTTTVFGFGSNAGGLFQNSVNNNIYCYLGTNSYSLNCAGNAFISGNLQAGGISGIATRRNCECLNTRDFTGEIYCPGTKIMFGLCGNGAEGRHNGIICCDL